jgi:type III restriction enzyme
MTTCIDLSNGLDQYKGYVVAEIDATPTPLSFTNGVELVAWAKRWAT